MYKVPKDIPVKERVRKVKEMLRLSMDGATAARLRGLNYRLVFGVTYPRLKELCAEIEPDNELAQNLWNLKQRESMILATMLTTDITADDSQKLISELCNEEIAEYLCRNLLVRADDPWKIVCAENKFGYSLYVSYSLAAQLLMKGEDNAAVSTSLIENAEQTILSSDKRILSAIANFLKRAYRTHQNEVLAVAERLSSLEDLKCRWVAEEVKTFIEFGG